MKKKSEVTACFDEFKGLVQTQTSKWLMGITTDNRSKFVNKAFAGYCQASGIEHQLTVSYSHLQNGMAEQMNRSVVEKARSMLHYMKIDLNW